MDNKNSATGSFLAGVLVGGAVGAVLALLFAPKSGRDLRRDIAETGEDLLDKAGNLIKKGETQGEQMLNEGRIRAQKIVSSARQQAESILSSADTVLQEARQRAQAVKDRSESFGSESNA